MAKQSKPARKPKRDVKPAVKAAAPLVVTPSKSASAAMAKPIQAASHKVARRPKRPASAPQPIIQQTRAAVAKVAKIPTVKPAIEGTRTMATTAETIATDTTAKLQGAFADVQGRAKGAMEKGAKFYEEMGDFTKGNVEAIVASGRVAASAMESIGQDAAAYGKKSLEQAQATFKSATAVKSPTELFQLQSDYARAAFDAMIAQGSAMTEKMMKLTGEVVQPLSSRFAVAAEKVKSAAL